MVHERRFDWIIVCMSEMWKKYGIERKNGYNLNGQNKSPKKQWWTKSGHRRKNCSADVYLIGRSQPTQKVGVEKDWVDPKINNPRQGDLGSKISKIP
ncbi:hypothetical protein TNCV_2063031 [Trichonephila clavipes]|nr:hypothetical protein TNCV_2063031 [Trichonephila clavipes]